MTKQRPPCSFENAIATIAGLIGWGPTAEICGVAERTVRNWSDPDTPAQSLTIRQALQLDVAFAEAGGSGTPILQAYAVRLDAETVEALFSVDRLAEATMSMSKENGEAIAAAVAALRPGASEAERLIARREIEEAIAASQHTLTQLAAQGP